jgi:hypothetical protein
MSNFSVADVCTGQPDSTGAPIRDVYTKVEGVYAVYQTDERVMIHFADDEALGADQRKSLADLYITRGTINWMLDELRATSDQNRIARATLRAATGRHAGHRASGPDPAGCRGAGRTQRGRPWLDVLHQVAPITAVISLPQRAEGAKKTRKRGPWRSR